MSDTEPVKILITGFGPFRNISTNPSWEITRLLPTTFVSQTTNIPIQLIIPSDPLPAAYHKIHTQIPNLIAQHSPDIALHIGLDDSAAPGEFKLEKSAQRDGYHEIVDVERKVFTKVEGKKVFGKSAARLESSVDIEGVVEAWKEGCKDVRLFAEGNGGSKGKKKSKNTGRRVDVAASDDVGSYVCGFCYYVSLGEMLKRKGRGDAVFVHVPMLEEDEEVGVGVKVVEALLGALVNARH